MGFGAGYHIEEFIILTNSKIKLVCIEPDASIFQFSEIQNQKDKITKRFKERNSELLIVESLEQFQEFLQNTSSKNFYFFSQPFYGKNHKKWIEEIYKILNSQKTSIHQNTVVHFSKLWIRNYFKNLHKIKSKNSCTLVTSEMFEFLKGQTVVFCGASPILENQVEWIRKNREHFFLISSDTASYFLQNNGIKIDLIFSVDSGRGTIYHFREDLYSDIPIFTWLGASPHLFEIPNPILIYMSTFPLDQILQNRLENLSLISNPSMNVAGLAKSFCLTYNVKKLIYCGLDFKSYFGKTHCRGTGYENYSLGFQNRIKTLDSYIPVTYKQTLSYKNQIAYDYIKTPDKLEILFFQESDNSSIILDSNTLTNELPFSSSKLNVEEIMKILRSSVYTQKVMKMLNLEQKKIKRIFRLLNNL
ncbi:MAG: motility associated factor glycosyltransferase family protein [Leptospiraceae bacterium]|nr:motility associated factor glycosyltransferase family protein [Leptospiraceae bacterium]MCP5494080.1 motility associated factor glycosyltransferase family protein [Leptospiraceae bacterium]